ncbi:MAG: hypothetical protein ACXWJM_17395 [Ramlibacter sp.]
MEKGNQETKRDRDRYLATTPAEEETRERQDFADSGLTGQGAQSALEHLVAQEKQRANLPQA